MKGTKLKYIPENNNSESGNSNQVFGIMPLVLSRTKIDDGDHHISGLGIADSQGRVWGIHAGTSASGGQQYNENTPTYTLDLDKTVSSTSPAYTLTLNDGGDGLVSEFRWSSDKWADSPNDQAYKYFLGMSIDAPDYRSTDGKSNFLTLFGGDTGNNDFILSSVIGDQNRTLIIMRSPYLNEPAKIMSGHDKKDDIKIHHEGLDDNNGYHVYEMNFDFIISADNKSGIDVKNNGVIKHQLVFKPITDRDIEDMQNTLNQNSTKTPLLPNYGI